MITKLVDETTEYNENKSFFTIIRENIIQFLLLIAVFFIIYYADKITRYNLSTYGLPNVINPSASNTNNNNANKSKITGVKRKIKK